MCRRKIRKKRGFGRQTSGDRGAAKRTSGGCAVCQGGLRKATPWNGRYYGWNSSWNNSRGNHICCLSAAIGYRGNESSNFGRRNEATI